MLNYVYIGANDVEASGRFYEAVLSPLGYESEFTGEQYCFWLAQAKDKFNGPGTIHVAKPFDGQPANAGNGMMLAFATEAKATVDAAYTAGLANGGTDDGAPGYRERYDDDFYVAYLRDPLGNKIAVFFIG
ncbi:glyoxalase/bleomycin resistance protein/dioxygenase [Paucimonas lemoignei]|jgi:catechol 2,3-dioxygenase-like lactoylglutathione lyase family enzyme|nr:glyoxalase/bleomycin resistance protein/dioxygenase [Paucimonas lemoignei]